MEKEQRIAELKSELVAIKKFFSGFKNKEEVKRMIKDLEPKLVELALLTDAT